MTIPLKPTVLIVEDDEQIIYLLNFLLDKEGFQTIVAKDGRQAESQIDTMELPSLVLMDVILPYADGFFLVRHIRSKPEWQHVPIVMLTSKSQEADVARAFQEGVNDYIVKPFQPQDLISRVKRFLDKVPSKPILPVKS